MEITANAPQTVDTNQNLIFTDIVVPPCRAIAYRPGSGLVILRGLTRQARARFRISFSGNISIGEPITEDTILSMAFAVNGEPIPVSTMSSSVVQETDVRNISKDIFVDVPCCCCLQLSVKNVGTTAVSLENSVLIVERVA